MLEPKAYFDRIGYHGSAAPTLDTLRQIHRDHMIAVPFENLDIARGRKIMIDEEAFVRKVVERRRGGFCYELNGAFATLLRSLGFTVTLLSARAVGKTGIEGPEFDHLCLRVDSQEPWLADVGFGDCFLEPLRLQPGVEQTDPAGTFRIVPKDQRFQLEKLTAEGGWKEQYSFSQQPRSLDEFAGMCHYHQTSPESPFTRKSICSRATPDGRITLADMKLIVTKNGERTETALSSEKERKDALREHFGIIED